WKNIQSNQIDSVFLQTWHVLPKIAGSDALLVRWARLRALRGDVLKKMEAVRVSGAIGSSLAANVNVIAGNDDAAFLQSFADDLRFVFITSQATVENGAANDMQIVVTPSQYKKCERCWHYRSDVGSDKNHSPLCGRCVSNLYGAGEERTYA
ncbi:MAG: zinc finger domain-containing protein, partial [Burkholderiales bacterium]